MGKGSKLILIGIAAVPGMLVLTVIAAAAGAMLAVFLLSATIAEVIGGP